MFELFKLALPPEWPEWTWAQRVIYWAVFLTLVWGANLIVGKIVSLIFAPLGWQTR